MPHDTPCIQCGRVGFVRMERVIKGSTLHISYYCGACDHTWQITQEDPRRPSSEVKLRPAKDRRRK